VIYKKPRLRVAVENFHLIYFGLVGIFLSLSVEKGVMTLANDNKTNTEVVGIAISFSV